MKVLVGLTQGAGQHGFDLDMSETEFLSALSAARNKTNVLDITDTKGDRILITAESIAFVQIRAEKDHKVGFGREL